MQTSNSSKIFQHDFGIKVSETASVERYSHNSRFEPKEDKTALFVPNKNISEFKLDRNKHERKDYSFDVGSKSSRFDEKISEIERKIK